MKAIVVEGNNWFHEGWLARYLGLDRERVPFSAGSDERPAFEDGWDCCNETALADRVHVFKNMLKLGQAKVYWAEVTARSEEHERSGKAGEEAPAGP